MNFTKFEKRANPLLERTEISVIFDVKNSSFNRREASTLIAKEAKINPDTVYSIKLSNSAGSHYVSGLFYVYKDEKGRQKILEKNIPIQKKNKELSVGIQTEKGIIFIEWPLEIKRNEKLTRYQITPAGKRTARDAYMFD